MKQVHSNVYESSAPMALIIILALAPIVGLLRAQKKLGALNAAAWLVTFGAALAISYRPISRQQAANTG